MDYAAMGERIRFRRKRLLRPQQEIAEAVHITRSYYGNIEKGSRYPSIDTLVAIANALGVGTDELLYDSLKAPGLTEKPPRREAILRYLREHGGEEDETGYVTLDGAAEEEEEPWLPAAQERIIRKKGEEILWP